VKWTLGDGEIDFEDWRGKWFLQEKMVQGRECKDW